MSRKMEKWSYKTVALCPCNYEFHRKCRVKWLKTQKNNNNEEDEDKYELTCPVCRNSYTIKSLKNKTRLFEIPKMSLKTKNTTRKSDYTNEKTFSESTMGRIYERTQP
jgi:hypothetical protein